MNDEVLCLRMPICGHKIHTKCALAGAQYDTRCPVCRTKHPDFQTEEEEESHIPTIEDFTRQHQRIMRQYNRKRRRIINNSAKLTKFDIKLKLEQKNYNKNTQHLSQKWNEIQRYIWMSDPAISELKKERKYHQQKINYLSKRLEKSITDEIGSPPQNFLFQMF
jgi:DNA repair exonuclease SbcCD ATPase subunit